MISFFYFKALRNPVMYSFVNSRPRLKPWRTEHRHADKRLLFWQQTPSCNGIENYIFLQKLHFWLYMCNKWSKTICRIIRNAVSFIQYCSMDSIDLRDYFLTRLYSEQSKPKQIWHTVFCGFRFCQVSIMGIFRKPFNNGYVFPWY